MNILEAYIKSHGQIIILIIGLPCTNKSKLAKELGSDLNASVIKIADYLDKTKYVEHEEDGFKFKLYNHRDNYDWAKLNHDVNEKKSKGVVIYGNDLDIGKIDFKIDFTFFYSMSKTMCKNIMIERKIVTDKEEDQARNNVYFDKMFFPMYENLKNELKTVLKINRFVNVKPDTNFDETCDELFNNLMELIDKDVHKK